MKTPLSLLLICLLSLSTIVRAQTNQQQPDDVLRISTELVQTGVAVFDKQGRFVDGLKKEDFEVLADGQPVEVSLFDRVIAGSPREEAQVARAISAAGAGGASAKTTPAIARGTMRGRTVIFFIDDYHLSATSVERTRRAVLQFIENDMGPLDQVAIASPTGQIGFLQQFSDNKAVLRAAIARLNHRPYVVEDSDNIKMTEYNAVRVSQGDKDTLDYFVTELLKATNFNSGGGAPGPPTGGPAAAVPGASSRMTTGLTRQQAEGLVKSRAEMMLKQSVKVTQDSLSTLEKLMRASQQLPGRKLVFLISDGFYMIDRKSGANDMVRRITDAAVRAGVVIYSMDARGMQGSGVDATSNRADPMGRLSRGNAGEIQASQDGLNALAEDTGGRALFNNDGFNEAMTRAMRETSNYYLLAWKPTLEEQKGGRFRKVEVSVKGRPELTVRMPRGYFETTEAKATNPAATNTATSRNEKASSKGEASKPVEADFRDALTALAARRGIPTIVDTSYLDTPNNGTVLTTSMQVAAEGLGYGADGKQPAAVDVAGMVFNEQGKPAASFKTRLNINPLSSDPSRPDTSSVIYNYKAPLKPGLYQIRVAARDDRTGRVGSAMQWIEIPDLTQKRLTLSSLLIGGQAVGSADKKLDAQQIQFSVDHRFSRASHLGFWIFIYNAQMDAQGRPDVSAQVQVFRDNQSIVNTQPRRLSTTGMSDLARIPYGGDFALSGLQPGRYILQVTITDAVAKTSASQRAVFEVE